MEERPIDPTPRHTSDLPPTPLRDRTVLATAWVEAPRDLLDLGHDLAGSPTAEYKRRIGGWLLWRAGPARGGRARYWAAPAVDLSTSVTFTLAPDGSGTGTGPSGTQHSRFRTWKEDLRDSDASKVGAGAEDEA
jgi:hypothetical protein